MTQRLFLALSCPPPIIQELKNVQAELKQQFIRSRINWTHLDEAHLTIHFLGDVEEDKISQLVRHLRAKAAYPPPFDLRLKDVSAFPHQDIPHILHVTTTCPPALLALYRKNADALSAEHLLWNAKPFHPHITLGRIKVRSENPPLHTFRVAPLSFNVPAFVLLKSVLTSEGSFYQEIEKFSLKT